MIYNCATCPHMKTNVITNFKVYSCSKTGKPVPQLTTENSVTFLRVPLECPRSEKEVCKSEETINSRTTHIVYETK